MRRKLLLALALAVLGTTVTAAVVNAQSGTQTESRQTTQQSSSGVDLNLPGGGQDLPPVSSQPACSNLKDDDGDGLTDLADPGCSGLLDDSELDTAPPPPPPGGGDTGGDTGTGGTGTGTGGGPGGS